MGHCYSQKAENASIDDSCQKMSESTLDTSVIGSPKVNEFLKPRVLFVSLYRLWETWDDLPCDILLSSIVVINGRRSQMFPQTVEDLRAACDWPLTRLRFSQHFLQLIQCKDVQGLIIWLQDSDSCDITIDSGTNNFKSPSKSRRQSPSKSRRQSPSKSRAQSAHSAKSNSPKFNETQLPIVSENSDKIESQWEFISLQLSSIIDLFTHQCYNNLTLNKNFWEARESTTVCNELATCEGNFKALMELFKQSNPTLIPVIDFDERSYDIEVRRIRTQYSLFDNTEICFSINDMQSNSDNPIIRTELGDIVTDNDEYPNYWLAYDSANSETENPSD